MKLFSLPVFLFAAVAAVSVARYETRIAPELEENSRTVAAAKAPATVTGVVDRGDRLLLVGKDGPVAVARGTSLWKALSQANLSKAKGLPEDSFAVGLAPDPADPTRDLLVVWKRPVAQATFP